MDSAKLFGLNPSNPIGLLTLLLLIAWCLPAILLFRQKNNKYGVICLLLGLLGGWLFIPWIIAVIIAAKQLHFAPKKTSFLTNPLWKIYGFIGLGIGLIWIINTIKVYHTVIDTYGSVMSESINGMVIANTLPAVEFCTISVIHIFSSFAKSNSFWGWQMALVGLLPRLIPYSHTEISTWMNFILIIFVIVGVLFITYGLFHASAPQPATQRTTPQYVPPIERTTPQQQSPRAKGTILCCEGLFAGARFPLKNQETLYIGSDPALAHIILQEVGVAPLHLEITYRKDSGDYMVIRENSCMVLCGNAPLFATSLTAKANTKISIGSPKQTFMLL